MATPLNNDSDKRLRARLALTGEENIIDWKEKEEYLEKRKIEAAKAMASDEQKRKNEEEERARLHKIEAQKKLAELEAARKTEEELKKKDVSAQQRERDLAQEKTRQEKIKQILESQKEIEGIKKAPQSRLSSVHTLTDDLGEAIREKGFTAAMLAQSNKRDLREEDRPVSWKKTIVLTVSIILLLSGLTAISWSLWQRVQESRAPAQLAHNSILFADEHAPIYLKEKSSSQIRQELSILSGQSGYGVDREKVKDIYFIYEESKNTDKGMVIEKKIAGPELFATSTGLAVTDDLMRFLKPDFMLGVYVGPQPGVFYLFQTDYYKNSADALLKNENAILSQLLSPFLSTDTKIKIELTPFQDKMLKNRDVRLAADQDNNTLAVYSWLNKNTVAIATNELVLEKVIASFLTPKPVVK